MITGHFPLISESRWESVAVVRVSCYFGFIPHLGSMSACVSGVNDIRASAMAQPWPKFMARDKL